MNQIFDYVIAGSGAAGLMLSYRMSQDPFFKNKTVLLIDREEKSLDDRTWCFWEEGEGEWDHLTDKIWQNMYFGSPSFTKKIFLGEYRYKMIRSSKFYAYLIGCINKNASFSFVKTEVLNVEQTENEIQVVTTSGLIKCNKLFNSIPDSNILINQTKYHYLKQHFIGWFIKTEEKVFNPQLPVFMDFNLPQRGNTRFMYVLPISETLALIEYTLFSETLLPVEEYESAISEYLADKGIKKYLIEEKEIGNIPMTCFPFEDQNTTDIMFIGSAGGWTKPSTGYTFARTTAISKKLVDFLKREDDFKKFHIKNRYWYYDLVMLDVLYRNNVMGSEIFGSIFKNNTIKDILLFLDEKGKWYNDIKIMLKTKPAWNFSTSALRQILSACK